MLAVALDPDFAAMGSDDFAADRKTETGTGDFPSVQRLKGREDSLVVFRFDADTVVAHGDQIAFRLLFRRHFDLRRLRCFETSASC